MNNDQLHLFNPEQYDPAKPIFKATLAELDKAIAKIEQVQRIRIHGEVFSKLLQNAVLLDI